MKTNQICCRLCNVFVDYEDYEKHKQSETHLSNLEGKFIQKTNGKDYYYNKEKREKHLTKNKLKNPEWKEKHYNYLKQKIPCDNCGCVVMYSSMWRHKQSNKCRLHIK